MCRLLVILAAVTLCLPSGPAAPIPKHVAKPTFYPTRPGTKWTYRTGQREETFVVTGVSQKGGGTVVTVGREVRGEVEPDREVLLKAGGVFLLRAGDATFDPPFPELEPPVEPGREWVRDASTTIPSTWKRAVRGPERVKVPAGTFDAIRVEHTVKIKAGPGTPDITRFVTEWYSPGVGLLREVSHFAGDDEKEDGVLVSFAPPKQ